MSDFGAEGESRANDCELRTSPTDSPLELQVTPEL